jgi:predicted dehydrogenase
MTYIEEAPRIGILGYGFIGKVHQEIIESELFGVVSCGISKGARYKLLSVTTVAETDPSKRGTAKEQYRWHEDYMELLEKERGRLDALIVALPTREHLAAVKAITKHKIPFLLEKPLAPTYEEAREIVQCVEESGTPCMVGLTGRFHPEFTAAYQSMLNGDIGEVASMQERIHFGLPAEALHPYLQPEHSGRGIGLENGIHTMDRLNFFSRSQIVKVEGLIKSNKHLGQLLEDYVAGVAVNDSGMHIPFSLRWSPHKEEDYVFQVTGTEGRLEVEGFKRCTLVKGSDESCRKVLYEHDLTKDFRERHKPGIRAELEHFHKYFLEQKYPNLEQATNNLLHEALAAQKAVELLYAEK